MSSEKPVLKSNIWSEEAETDNPFATKASFCYGYNVTSEILPNASLAEYLFLLFSGKRADKFQAKLFEKIAVAVANPGMRDLSIRAAMNAGVGGSNAAACLMAALGVGAGQYGGAHEVYTLVESWQKFDTNIEQWVTFLNNPNSYRTHVEFWPLYDHPPGFDPNGDSCPTIVVESLSALAAIESNKPLNWLQDNRSAFEKEMLLPISMTMVIAAAFYQLGFDPRQSEMLYLILRLPGAAVHALEQETFGWKNFPFFGNKTILTDDPGGSGLPTVEGYEP